MFRFTIRDVLWLTVVVACGSLAADEPGPTLKELRRQLSVTPIDVDRQLDDLRDHLRYHAGPDFGRRSHLLVIHWFGRGGRSALQYTVTQRGINENARVTPRATQDWQSGSLATENLKRLADLLQELPESKEEPPIEQTVFVSFQSGEKWRTETYDAAKLPDEFEKVMLVIGERFETKDRREKNAK